MTNKRINYSGLRRILTDLPMILLKVKQEKFLTLDEMAYDAKISRTCLHGFLKYKRTLKLDTLIIIVEWLEKVQDESALHIKERIRKAHLLDAKNSLSDYRYRRYS